MLPIVACAVVALLLWVLFGPCAARARRELKEIERRELDEREVFNAELGGYISRAAQEDYDRQMEMRRKDAEARRCEALDGTGAPWREP